MKQFLRKIAKETSFIMLSILFSTSCASAMRLVNEQTISIEKKEEIEPFVQTQKTNLFFNLINPFISNDNEIINLLDDANTIQQKCNDFVEKLWENQQNLLNTTIDQQITILIPSKTHQKQELKNYVDILGFLLGAHVHLPAMYIIYDFGKKQLNDNKNYKNFLTNQNKTLLNSIKESIKNDRNKTLSSIHFLSLITFITTHIVKRNNIDSNDNLIWVKKIIHLIDALWNALKTLSEDQAQMAEEIADTMLDFISTNQQEIQTLISSDLYNNLDTLDSFINNNNKDDDQEPIINCGIKFKKLMLFYLLQTKPYVLMENDLQSIHNQLLAEQLLLAEQCKTEQPSGWFSGKFWIGLGIFTLTTVGVGYLGYLCGWWGGTKNSDTIPQPQNLTTAITQFGTKMLNVPEDMCQHDLGLICNTTQDFDNSKTLPYSQHTNNTNTLHCNNQGQCIDEKNIAIVNAEGNSTKVTDILTQEKQNIITPNLKHFCNLTKHADKCPELLQQYQAFLKSAQESGEIDKMHCKGKFEKNITNTVQNSSVEQVQDYQQQLDHLALEIGRTTLQNLALQHNNTLTEIQQLKYSMPKDNDGKVVINITELPILKSTLTDANNILNQLQKTLTQPKTNKATQQDLFNTFNDMQTQLKKHIKNIESIILVKIPQETFTIKVETTKYLISSKKEYTLPKYGILINNKELIKIELDNAEVIYDANNIQNLKNNLKAFSQNGTLPSVEKIKSFTKAENDIINNIHECYKNTLLHVTHNVMNKHLEQ